MRPPIILGEAGDVTVYATQEDAERSVEPIDVKRELYIAYDSEGRALRFIVHTKHGLFSREWVSLQEQESEPTHQQQLHDLLCTFLQQIGIEEAPNQDTSLADLINKVGEASGDIGLWDWLRRHYLSTSHRKDT